MVLEMIEALVVFSPWYLAAGCVGFAVSVFSTSSPMRAFTWFLIPIALGVAAFPFYGVFFIGLPMILFLDVRIYFDRRRHRARACRSEKISPVHAFSSPARGAKRIL